MRGKVKISYMQGGLDRPCCADLSWGEGDSRESVFGYGKTWDEAKREAIEYFKSIPPSEEMEIV